MRTIFSNSSKGLALSAILVLSGYFGVNQFMSAGAVSEAPEAVKAVSSVEELVASNTAEPKPQKVNNITPNAANNTATKTVNTINVSTNNKVNNTNDATKTSKTTATVVKTPVKRPANQPVYISIGGYISSSIQTVGLTSGGAIAVPGSSVGWWNGSSKPDKVGAAFFVGHSPGILGGLKNVPIGANIKVTMDNESVIRYKVVDKQVYDYIWNNPTDQRNRQLMTEALSSRGGSKGLNIMTCHGTPVGGTYSQRLVVYAQQV